MRPSCVPSDVSRYGKYRTAVRSGTNAFELRWHIFWEAYSYYFSPPTPIDVWLPCCRLSINWKSADCHALQVIRWIWGVRIASHTTQLQKKKKKKEKIAVPNVLMLAYLLERFCNRSLIHGSSMVWSWVWFVPKYSFKDQPSTSRVRGSYFQPGTQTLNLYILLLFQPWPAVLEPIMTNTRCFQNPEIVQFGIMKRK